MQRRCSFESIEFASGFICSGRAASSHGLRGIEEMTTCGTWYCSCRMRRAVCSDGRSFSFVSVRTSTSNQFGVMTVASGNRSLYTGITSAATYSWPASPITGSKRYINPSFVAFNFCASCATAVRASAPGI